MLRAGIIGLGVGEAHIAGYHSHPDCRVTTLCDFDPEKVRLAKAKYSNLKVVEDAQEVLADPEIDVVSIASYDNFHCEQILQAIAANKHVFVEKPVCLFEEEAKQIQLALSKKKHIKLSSNLILRQSPRFIELRKRIRAGELGRLFHIEGDYFYGRLPKVTEGWRGKLDYYSATHGGAIHLIDLMTWLSSDEVSEVMACGNRIATLGTQFRYNDSVTAILKFKGGMTGKVSVHFGSVHPHFHRLTVMGTQGTFLNEREHGTLFTSSATNTKPQLIQESYPGVEKGGLVSDFVDSILRSRESIVTQEEVFKVMNVCFAIERACTVKGVTTNDAT